MTITFNTAGSWTAGERGNGFSLVYQANGPGIIPGTTAAPGPSTTTGNIIVVTTEGSASTTKGTETTAGVQTTYPPSGNFPPGTQDDSQCGVPAFSPQITGFDYVAQGAAVSESRSVPSPRVVNGEEAIPHSWPWQASLQGSQGSAYCGGTLVQSQWVVTAAHCAALVFIGTYASDQVLLGAHDKRSAEASAQLIDIVAKYVHPQYDNPDRSHDVALVKLKTPAVLNEYVSLACEAHAGWSFLAGMQCVVTGWGVTKEGGNIGTGILQQAPLPLMSDTDCYTLYQEANLDTTSDMQCAGGQGKGACNGDSGGPLNCYVNNRWYHMGIVSFGEANCDTDIASVFAKVAELRSFIDSTIAQHS
ncbi:chymotrypsin B-like [Styela clava]